MSTKNSQNLLDTIRAKIAELLADFQKGEMSREQFNIIYTRYHKQLELAYRAAIEDQKGLDGEAATFRFEDIKMEKTLGIAIYHQSGQMIETLGTYELPSDRVLPTLMEQHEKIGTETPIKPKIEAFSEGQSVVYITGNYATAIIVFRNEPGQFQIKDLQAIMGDFEAANRQLLEKENIDNSKLAQPFTSIIKLSKG